MRLPVIQTCDMCSEYVVRAADGSGRCVHLRLGGDVLGASPPPSWCPLRTGPDAERIAALEAVASAAEQYISPRHGLPHRYLCKCGACAEDRAADTAIYAAIGRLRSLRSIT